MHCVDSGSCLVVKHLTQHKNEDLSPAIATGTGRESGKKECHCVASCGSTVIEHLSHHLDVEDLSTTISDGTRTRKESERKNNNIVQLW
jgi:hypothetical protein